MPEIWDRLQAHFGVPTRAEVLVRLGIDCRVVSYDSYCAHPDVLPEVVDPQASLERSSVGGMWRRWEADGSNRDIWGAHRRRVVVVPGTYDLHLRPLHQRLIDVAAQFGKPVMLHSCGAVFLLIPRLIDMGVNILNPIQPGARGMEPENLARQFGSRLAFHGGIDIQELLPRGTPSQVKAETARVGELLGRSGGYILASAHHVQADTPVENVLAMYDVP